jgi:hypothetical protein
VNPIRLILDLVKVGRMATGAVNEIVTGEARHVESPRVAALQGVAAAVLIEGTPEPVRLEDVAEGALIAKTSLHPRRLDGWTLVTCEAVETPSVETFARVLSYQLGVSTYVLEEGGGTERWVCFGGGTQKSSGGSWKKLESQLRLPAGTLAST